MAGMKGAAFRPWTEARKARIVELIAEGRTRPQCLVVMNDMDGPLMSMASLCHHLYTHRLKLTPEARLAVARQSGKRSLRIGAPLRITPERLAYLREAWPRGDDPEAVYAVLMAMDGPPLKSAMVIYHHAKRHGIKRPLPVRADPVAAKERDLARRRARHAAKKAARPPKPTKANQSQPKPTKAPIMRLRRPLVVREVAPVQDEVVIPPSPERADAVVAARYARVRAALGRRGVDPGDVARATGVPLREVYRVAGEMRREAMAS